MQESSLTPREKAVLQRVFAGRVNKEIAIDLGCTEHSVKQMLSRVYQKLGVNHVRQLFPLVIMANRELRETVEIEAEKRFLQILKQPTLKTGAPA